MCACVQWDGREDEMKRGTAAVYLHGISAFEHKHKNNTIKLPWRAIRYHQQRRGPYIPLCASLALLPLFKKMRISFPPPRIPFVYLFFWPISLC